MVQTVFSGEIHARDAAQCFGGPAATPPSQPQTPAGEPAIRGQERKRNLGKENGKELSSWAQSWACGECPVNN